MAAFLWCFLLAAGTGIQQLALYRRSKQYISLSPGEGRGQQVLFALGLGCEVTAVALLPFATATILAALHVLCFVLHLTTDEERPLLSYEKRGCAGILMGCVLMWMWGGERRPLEPDELEGVASPLYCIWTLASLVLNCSLRRLGFYEGRPLLESCIPAQVTAIGMCSLKYLFLTLESSRRLFPLMFSAILIVSTLHISAAFLGILLRRHDRLVTMGSFYGWLVMYQLPSGVLMLGVGVNYTFLHYVVISIAALLTTAGAGLVAYLRVQEIEADLKDKKTAYQTHEDVDSHNVDANSPYF